MKNKIFNSVRMEIVTYVIISIFLSLLTTAIVSLAVFMAKDFIEEGGKTYSFIASRYHDNLLENEMDVEAKEYENYHETYEDTRIVFAETNYFNIFLIVISIVSFVFFFMVYFLAFTKKITDYFNDLNKGLLKVAEGDFDVVFEVRNENELSNVSNILNNTLSDIKNILTKERDEERSRREFITSIAHDLRTPLTSIIGYLELVMSKQGSAGDEEFKARHEYVKIAYDKALRLQALIENLFSFAKTDSVGMEPHFEEIDIVKLVGQLVDECYPSIYDAGLLSEFHTNSTSIPLSVDGELMARAIANLLTNAIKYGKDGKKLIVEIEERSEEVKIRVINYGRLIPAKDLTRIFEKFYRVEESRSAETGGTGLGLAITQNIVKLHQGRIEVRSDLDGTVFEVILPKCRET